MNTYEKININEKEFVIFEKGHDYKNPFKTITASFDTETITYFKTICLKDYFLGIVFQGNIEEVIKYVKSNYDNEETKECVVYTLHFPHAVIEVGI